jgi:hypothetical protein
MRNLKSKNFKLAYFITIMIFLFGICTVIIPLIFVYMIPNAGITYYITQHQNYFLFTIPILLYFIMNGVFLYELKIDYYVIQIKSHRTITGFLGPKNYIDISHKMLKDYSFFDRPFSLNKTLMVKIKCDNKRVIKRFNMTLISDKEIEKISKILDRIIVKNN